MFKKVISWIIAIVAGYAVIKVVFWLINIVFSFVWTLIMIGLVVIIAIPASKFIYKKLLSK
jgi:ABC-type glycerol-3-phosphate transport system permease component